MVTHSPYPWIPGQDVRIGGIRLQVVRKPNSYSVELVSPSTGWRYNWNGWKLVALKPVDFMQAIDLLCKLIR